MINYKFKHLLIANGHKGDGDPEGELLGNNGEGNREYGEGDRIASKGKHPVLKGEPLGEEEPDLFMSVFVSSISVLGSTFPTNTKKQTISSIKQTMQK